MKRKYIFVITILLLIGFQYARCQSVPPPLRNVIVRASVNLDEETGVYSYNYAITNSFENTLDIYQIYLDIGAPPDAGPIGDWQSLPHEPDFDSPADYGIPGTENYSHPIDYVERDYHVQTIPYGAFSPQGWGSGYIPESPFITLLGVPALAYWGTLYDCIAPGNELSGFQMTSYGLPGIREMEFSPDIDELRDSLPNDWYPSEADYRGSNFGKKMGGAMRKERELGCKATTIGATSPPNIPAIDFSCRIQNYVNQSAELGWLIDADLAQQLNAKLEEINNALLIEDYENAQILSQELMQLIKSSTSEQCNSECQGLLYYNAKYLYEKTTRGIEKSIELTPLSAEHSLNEIHQAVIAVEHGIQPVPNYWIQGDIISGPHEGEHQEGYTDDEGNFLFSYKGIKEGTDKILASMRPPSFQVEKNAFDYRLFQNYWESTPSYVTWKGGSDLTIYSLFPPLIKIPAKVDKIPIKESTINIGTTAAPKSKTRYYLSIDQKVDPDDYVLHNRDVPPLAPNQMDEYSIDIPFPDLQSGNYWLIACADADNEIAELNEDNNCDTVAAEVFFPVQRSENLPPQAQDQAISLDMDTSINIILVATDPENDPLTYNIANPPAHGALSGMPPQVIYIPIAHYFGMDSFTFKANDGHSDSNIATISITIKHPPDCTHASASPNLLWPPNHKMRSIQITGVTDPAGGTINIQVTSIKQDEPVNGLGDGDTSPDGIAQPLQVRSERSGTANERVYHIGFIASDEAGSTCTRTVTVCVPHDQNNHPCIDEGPLYDSTQQ